MLQYHYKPLGDTSIRTLRLLPGKFDDPLRGCIEHRGFFHPRHRGEQPGRWVPIYEALSYAWGAQDDLQILSIVNDPTEDESFLRIGKNLSLALRDLRSTSEPRIIWCDAVCINQHDLPERAAQVQRMADIFRHADRVVVWLAPHDEQVTRALQLLDEYGSHIYYDNYDDRFTTPEGMDGPYLEPDYLVPLTSYDWRCVAELISLPWFTRIWVRQEIQLANDLAIIASGRHRMLWSKFASAILFLYSKLKWDETVLKAAQMPSMTALARNVWDLIASIDQRENSLHVVERLDGCQCTDPRDRIYGIIGRQLDVDIPVDYEKTAKEVYADWAMEYHKYHSSLAFLIRCEMASSPSWVPDLDKPPSAQLKNMHSVSTASCKAFFDLLPDKSCKMLAIRCGSIDQHTSTMLPEPDLEDIQNTLESWARQLLHKDLRSYDSPAMDHLATAVSGGRGVENKASGKFSMPEVKNVLLGRRKAFFLPKHRRKPIQMASRLAAELQYLLPNTAVFVNNDGHFGLGSGAVLRGDAIFVVLGCRFPIIMRPVKAFDYRIVGPCYIPQLSHGEAILGPLPDGWKATFANNNELYFVAPDGSRTLEDPRLEELPPGCAQSESRSGGYLLWKRTEDQEWSDFDPRLTPEKLETRGVKLEMIRVV